MVDVTFGRTPSEIEFSCLVRTSITIEVDLYLKLRSIDFTLKRCKQHCVSSSCGLPIRRLRIMVVNKTGTLVINVSIESVTPVTPVMFFSRRAVHVSMLFL